MVATPHFLCIHGHFYQPPRENPWIDEIEVQDSAAPFHDWNARIAAECYGPNAAARVLVGDRRIAEVVNNYSRISFNFGPTLLSWLERTTPAVYQAILDADRQSAAARGGHGNALAQAYNHTILPLTSPRDSVTQVRWGLADFRARFGRRAEGMWLPETAVNLESLEVLAAEGVRFTVLSPYQAAAVRGPGVEKWTEAGGGRVDPTRPYTVKLPSGAAIAVFFYDGPIAKALAFEGGLSSPDELLRKLQGGYVESRGHVQLLNVAVDGETFGHHRKQGDEVLASALQRAQEKGITLTNYGQFLELHPPEWEAKLVAPSSWSCTHGVERWRSDCGCQGSGQPGWKQSWRAPLRAALDLVRDGLAAYYERAAGKLLADPWAARDDYVELLLDRDPQRSRRFLSDRERTPGQMDDAAARTQALRLLELQRHAMLMYTSCGWFFAEVSGLETVQVLRYAARALQLATETGGPDLEPSFLQALRAAPSNLPSLGDAATVYEREVRPSIAHLENVVAHHAMSRLLDGTPEKVGRVFCFRFRQLAYRRESAGPATLSMGRVQLTSDITGAALEATFAVLHFGGHDIRCVVRPYDPELHYAAAEEELFRLFARFSLAEVVRAMDVHFPGAGFALRDLFLDERRALARKLLRETLARYERDLHGIFEENRGLMRFLVELNTPAPETLRAAAGLALGNELRALASKLEAGTVTAAAAQAGIAEVVAEAKAVGVRLETELPRRAIERLVADRLRRLLAAPRGELAQECLQLFDLGDALGVRLDLWGPQNLYWEHFTSRGPRLERDLLLTLGERLFFDRRSLEVKLRSGRTLPAKPPVAGVGRPG